MAILWNWLHSTTWRDEQLVKTPSLPGPSLTADHHSRLQQIFFFPWLIKIHQKTFYIEEERGGKGNVTLLFFFKLWSVHFYFLDGCIKTDTGMYIYSCNTQRFEMKTPTSCYGTTYKAELILSRWITCSILVLRYQIQTTLVAVAATVVPTKGS